MSHVMGARCIARDLHTIVPWPVGDSSRRSEEFVKNNLELRLSVSPLVVFIIINSILLIYLGFFFVCVFVVVLLGFVFVVVVVWQTIT